MSTPGPRVACVNLGCRVNRVELDDIAAELEAAGCAIVDEAEAQLVVVNSCAVTGEAQAKTRKAVRHAAALPQQPYVVATGCAVMLFPDELCGIAPGVVVEPDKSRVARRSLELLDAQADLAAAAVERTSVTPTGRTRPGVKVQDGCDNRCTYCIVWKARGASRSVAYADVLARVRACQAAGAPEVVLTGVNLGRYSCEDPVRGHMGPAELLMALLEDTDVPRFRLSSFEPDDVDDAVLEAIAGSKGRVAPFLHMPLQSGCKATLRRMARKYVPEDYARVVRRARELVPGIALGCDLIVGFPGETDTEFEESLAFCEAMGFSRMHVFRYSPRPGTPAATMEGQVDPRVKAERASRMHELAERMRAEQARELVGTSQLACVQYPGRAVTGGLFDILVDDAHAVGSMVPVVVRAADDAGQLDGRTAPEPPATAMM